MSSWFCQEYSVSIRKICLQIFANHRNKRPFVSTANEALFGTFVTIDGKNDCHKNTESPRPWESINEVFLQKHVPFHNHNELCYSPSRHVKQTVETSSAKFSATTNFLLSRAAVGWAVSCSAFGLLYQTSFGNYIQTSAHDVIISQL